MNNKPLEGRIFHVYLKLQNSEFNLNPGVLDFDLIGMTY